MELIHNCIYFKKFQLIHIINLFYLPKIYLICNSELDREKVYRPYY